MMSQQLISAAEREVLGLSKPFRHAAIKGAVPGIIAFLVFGYVPYMNPTGGLPSIPAAWIVGIGAILGWMFLALRLFGFVRRTRREDLFFVFGFDLSQRREVAAAILHKYRLIWLEFISGALLSSSMLEFAILHQHSIVQLIIMPVTVVLLLIVSAFCFRKIIGVLKPTPKDPRLLFAWPGSGSLYSRIKAGYVVTLSRWISRCAPSRSRGLVLRSSLYLFRAEPLHPLLFLVVPLVLVLLLKYLNTQVYGMNDFFLLVSVFIMQMTCLEPLREAAVVITEHPCCRVRGRNLLLANTILLAAPVMIALTLFPILVSPQTSVAYLIRILQFTLALLVSSIIVGRTTLSTQDKRLTFEFASLGLCGLGLFIALWGWIFIFISLCGMLVAEWKYVRHNEWYNEEIAG